MTDRDLTRRAFGGAALLGVAAPVLAACGDDEEPSSSGSATSSTPTESGSPSKGAGGSAAGGLVATADVPVGGGVILQEDKVVVTQPSEGTFKGFSAVCTHQGCIVASVADGEIACNCHGSRFSAEDGSVVNGPATAPLEAVEVTVKGDEVTRG